jgi:dipeptidyl-peptidase-4
VLVQVASAQDQLRQFPGYARYERLEKVRSNLVSVGIVQVQWDKSGEGFTFTRSGKQFHYDLEARSATQLEAKHTDNEVDESQPPKPPRGRQYTEAESPDRAWKAIYRDRNIWLEGTNGAVDVAVTLDGSISNRVKYGSASWVYGEELDQDTAMWWSPDSRKLAFYRFDESRVADYYVVVDQTKVLSPLDSEAYPKAGSNNPIASILIYDLATKSHVEVDVRSCADFEDGVLGHYVYGVSWSTNSNELLFHRTNRRQKILELCAANPVTGAVRVFLREEWLASWVENSPEMRFLEDGRRFIWASERTGWRNYYLRDLEGRELCALTQHNFEVAGICQVDENGGVLYYMALDGENRYKKQLHRVNLDGSNDRRLTAPSLYHTVTVSPRRGWFVDVEQTHDRPPRTVLRNDKGELIDELARSDRREFDELGLRTVEVFTFKAADGVTDLFGMLHYPSCFRPGRRRPVLVSVYAGPHTSPISENFTVPDSVTELGFMLAKFEARSAGGRGKRALDEFYMGFGKVEIADQAAGARWLSKRPYVDPRRIGVYGTSYGGTAAALCVLRYPDVFGAACVSAGVTDFRNYDTIYTERYLGLPQENPWVYDVCSVLLEAYRLKRPLLLYHGTADDNVHPANLMQLIKALQSLGKHFEVQLGPDQGHGSVNEERMLESLSRVSAWVPPGAINVSESGRTVVTHSH